MTSFASDRSSERRCMNCGLLPGEHDPWPQCPDGGEGWRRRMAADYRDRLAHPATFLAGQPRPRRSRSGASWLLALLGALVVLLALISLYNPHVNVPLVSPVVCSLKGDTWYGGGILGAPGCYSPSGSAGSAPASEPTCSRPPPGDAYPIYPPGCIPPDTAAPAATVPPAASALSKHYGPYPGSLPMPHVNGATWWVTVDCLTQQCTTIPGAGPEGSTCGQPVSNDQVCAG
jgi:hypothetical protein